MRDIHVMEIMSRMINDINYSKVMCRYYTLKERIK